MAAAETALGAAISAEAKEQAEEPRRRQSPRSLSCRRNGTPPRRICNQSAMRSRLRARLPSAAETARAAAAEAARQVARELEPVSVLISRKTQRLYVRQAFEPIFESPVTIAIPIVQSARMSSPPSSARPTVLTCDGTSSRCAADLPWRGRSARPARGSSGRNLEPMPTDPESAKAALDRIVIPQDALDRIAGIAPRSSLIVTDEALSSETGKGTDFVVLLSGEPQGGIKSRRRDPGTDSATRAHAACLLGARLSGAPFRCGEPILLAVTPFSEIEPGVERSGQPISPNLLRCTKFPCLLINLCRLRPVSTSAPFAKC